MNQALLNLLNHLEWNIEASDENLNILEGSFGDLHLVCWYDPYQTALDNTAYHIDLTIQDDETGEMLVEGSGAFEGENVAENMADWIETQISYLNLF